MLKSNVGHSINSDSYLSGFETATDSIKGLSDTKFSFLYTSCKSNITQVINGIKNVTDTPFIGCTTSNGVITNDGIITSDDGFTAMLTLADANLTVGVACKESGKDARQVGRRVAIEAVQNAKSTRAPAAFYMIATPGDEEDYLMGIQDVIGRVPMFGCSAADENFNQDWKLICNDKVIKDGVAVAFFYTDTEIETTLASGYKETNNYGIVTEVEENRTILTVDNTPALKKYAHWINMSALSLKGNNLFAASITKPLGIKDPVGNITLVRHPYFGDDRGTKTVMDDAIKLGNKVVKGTTIIQLESTINELITSSKETLKRTKEKLYTDPVAYILIHSSGRRIAIGPRLEEVYRDIIDEVGETPFIMPFVYGEYGYDEHSANYCGGLMLSYTVFGKN